MPNYVQKLRATTTQNRHGFAESLKKQVSNKPVEYEDITRRGMTVEEVSRAYHTLQLIHTSKSEV
jgi:hypothetical protein